MSGVIGRVRMWLTLTISQIETAVATMAKKLETIHPTCTGSVAAIRSTEH